MTDTETTTFVDLTPNWEEMVNVLLMLYVNGDSEGRSTALAEFRKMAKLADAYVAEHKR